MTTSTLGTTRLAELLRSTRPGRTERLRAVVTAHRSARTGERSAARAYRARERALSGTSGAQRDELLALSRCG